MSDYSDRHQNLNWESRWDLSEMFTWECGFNNVRCINNNIKTYTNNLFWFAQIIFWTKPFLISVENNFILFNRTPRKNNALRQAWFTILFYSRFSALKHLILSQNTNGQSFMHNRFPGDFFIHNFVQLKGGKVGFRIKNLIFFRNACIRPQNSLYRRNLPWSNKCTYVILNSMIRELRLMLLE